jgi:hypothetical protein
MSLRVLPFLAVLACVACGSDSPVPAPSAAVPTPPAAAGPPKPLEGASITITSAGFTLDRASAAAFSIKDLHVYQGARLTFLNSDIESHDVLSDPLHIHTDCPEINAAGYLVPGQSRATDPLNRLRTCGFHDHTSEGDDAFSGKVTIEPR